MSQPPDGDGAAPTVSTGSPGDHSAELHSGVGDGRGGAGGGVGPVLGFCGMLPESLAPPPASSAPPVRDDVTDAVLVC
ncbi:hypothetical protein OG266_17160 [Streptomyces sp. NBC_00554]|uniref:hypothetical protein n=1 Tax=Streptomyces sp. NBC_00554 TaxID=2903661 RepID=UPI00352E4CA6|nr:hypothetical protein OG266_17160 [Streptomyces sp. NBC_00554]